MSAGDGRLVTVVVPTRDRPELLRRAIESIMGQTHENIECIVVFDQSEPALPEVEPRGKRTIRAIVNDRTPGLAGARNSGVMKAAGDLVAFCDDDDLWLPDKLTRQLQAMDRLAALTVTTGIYVNYRDRDIERRPPNDTVTFDDLLRDRMMEIHPSTILVQRDALLDGIGLVDEQIPGSYAEDYDWLLRAARAGVLASVRDPLVRVQWHQSSFFTARWDMIISALTYLLDKHPEFRREPAGRSRIFGQIAFAHAASGRRREAVSWARRALRLDPRQPRGYVALVVALGILRAEALLRLAHRFGRGI